MKYILAVGFMVFSLFPYAQETGIKYVENTYYEGTSVLIPENVTKEEMIKLAAAVRPSAKQLRYQEYGTMGFIHFNLNTFTGRQWGTGVEDLSIFNPKSVNVDQWMEAFVAAGVKSVIMVCKHHDGFRLWPSSYHSRNISKTPYKEGKGDLVKEVSEAAQRHGLRFCVYYSPWDKQEPYGTPAYNDLMVDELTELLTNYGAVDLVWFDGAGISTKVSGVEMDFDWDRIHATIHKLQPSAIISGVGPDVRWVGNEAGRGRTTEWCVQGVVYDTKDFPGAHAGVPTMAPELGDISQLMTLKGIDDMTGDTSKLRQLTWMPARGGLPVHTKWFWNPLEKVRSLNYLTESFFSTIGCNSGVILNMSPDTTGLVPEEDMAVMKAFGEWRRELMGHNYALGARAETTPTGEGGYNVSYMFDDDIRTGWVAPEGIETAEIVINLYGEQTFDVVYLQEMVADFGQRIEAFAVDAMVDGRWKELVKNTTVGFRRIQRVKSTTTDKIRIRILSSRLSPSLATVKLLKVPELIEPNKINKKKELSRDNWKTDAAIKDGDLNTCWTGELKDGKPAYIDIDLGEETTLSVFTYIPPQGSPEELGRVERFEVYVGNDPENINFKVGEGKNGNVDNNPVPQSVTLHKLAKGRYLRYVMLSATRGQNVVKIAEIKIEP